MRQPTGCLHTGYRTSFRSAGTDGIGMQFRFISRLDFHLQLWIEVYEKKLDFLGFVDASRSREYSSRNGVRLRCLHGND